MAQEKGYQFPLVPLETKVVGRGSTKETEPTTPVVDVRRFLQATRETGYRDTASALSELIDNSIDAGARTIRVILNEQGARESKSVYRSISLAVIDDGCGIDQSVLSVALQFGGSGHFNSRSRFGRFGMGLPNSSLSQARRVDVFTWAGSPAEPWCVHLDIDDVCATDRAEIRKPVKRALPPWIIESLNKSRCELGLTGTAVVWSKCDRIPYKKASTIRAKLINSLSQVYRHYLAEGVQILVDGTPIKPVDPLHISDSRIALHDSASLVGEDLQYQLKTPLTSAGVASIRVRFSLLPVLAWAPMSLDTRRAMGIIGGAGVSIVRGRREIDYGWHFMGSKRRENYDDWWRCEVQFDPALDEYFGVTHSKQGIRPRAVLTEILSPDIEACARKLNRAVRNSFNELNPRESTLRVPQRPFSGKKRQAVTLANLTEKSLPTTTKQISLYRVAYGEVRNQRMFVVTIKDGVVQIRINTDHPLCQSLVVDQRSKFAVELLLIAAARAELATAFTNSVKSARDAASGTVDDFISVWSDILATYSVKIRGANGR